MRFWITKNSELPVREQVIRQVVLGILSEDLPAGHKLPSVRARPAAFLDGNALINSTDENLEAFRWMSGAVEAIRKLNDRGYYVFVSPPSERTPRTVVAGDTFHLNAAMQQRLVAEGAHVDRFYGEPASPADIAPAHVTAAGKRKPVSSPIFNAMNAARPTVAGDPPGAIRFSNNQLGHHLLTTEELLSLEIPVRRPLLGAGFAKPISASVWASALMTSWRFSGCAGSG